jgi:hypothetical protein
MRFVVIAVTKIRNETIHSDFPQSFRGFNLKASTSGLSTSVSQVRMPEQP